MPRKHEVPTLIDLALCSVGEFVTNYGKIIIKPVRKIYIKNPNKAHTELQSMLKMMKCLLSSSIPWHLYDKMSVAIFNAIVHSVKETKSTYNDYALTTTFLSDLTVILHLVEVAVHSNLKTIEFPAWPKIMRHILYNKLETMVGLQVLDLGSGSAGWKTSDIEKVIINGVSAMPNLVCFILCFDCTDNIITALAQNCKKLQKLDATASRSVTNRSVTPLLACRELRQLKLFRTSMTVPGFADLFLEHTNIEDIGRCDEFGFALQLIQRKNIDVKTLFHIRTFESRNFSMTQMYLLVDTCPYITSLCLLRDEEINDLTILSTLSNLKELKLLSCDFYTHGIKRLLEIRGSTIASLHLEHVDEIDLNALISISQFCPDMRNLVFYNCEFIEIAPDYPRKLPVPPFKLLESIKCVAECANTHLEFLLSHCINVKFIQLGSSTDIGDATMRRILTKNPMRKLEELKILYSHDLSMRTVRLLMQNCENLRRLSELEGWEGITIADLTAFREELKCSNTDLDTSPTLSFA